MASGCVFNNYIDRNLDQKMSRTQNRALAVGAIPVSHALLFSVVLGICGVLLLVWKTNFLATGLAIVGFIIYVIWYSFAKYHTEHATLIGSVAGAIPPVVGYCAVHPHLDLAAFLLFAFLMSWQMPHFFAIALYRLKEYAAASIPLVPIKRGARATKIQMLVYVITFIGVSSLFWLCGYTSSFFLLMTGLLGGYWLWLSIQGFTAKSDARWARQMFLLSLVIIMTSCALIPFTVC